MARKSNLYKTVQPFFLGGVSLYLLWAAFEIKSEVLLFQSLFLLLFTLSVVVPQRVQIGNLNLQNRVTKALNWAVFIVVVPHLLVSYVPVLDKAHLPLVPDARLSVISARASPTFGTSQASSGRTYLTVTVQVRSVWNAWGMEASTRHLEFIAEETFDPVRGFRDIPGFCGAATPVPINDSVTCSLVFEIPTALSAGTLRFDDFEYVDEVEINF